jgi:hypothetical protein
MRKFLAIYWSHQNTLLISWDYPFNEVIMRSFFHALYCYKRFTNFVIYSDGRWALGIYNDNLRQY